MSGSRKKLPKDPNQLAAEIVRRATEEEEPEPPTTPPSQEPSKAEYLKKPYERVVIPQESGRYYAKIAEFPGCYTDGETLEEALSNLEEVASEWIEEELKKGRDIPPPWQDQKYSGRIMLRISPILHEELAENAQRQDVSLNQYIMQKLSAKTREDSVIHIFREQLRAIRPVTLDSK